MKYIILCLLFLTSSYAQTGKRKEKIIYKYKKFEKFNLEDISVDGESGNPGDFLFLIDISENLKTNYLTERTLDQK